MTVPGVSCKALATQNSSEWPCSMCPISLGSGLWGWRHPTYIFLIFPGHPESWTPSQIPSWGPPLGCTLLHYHLSVFQFTFCLPQVKPLISDWLHHKTQLLRLYTIFQSYRHLANFKSINQPLSKIKKDYKLHEDMAATAKCLTECSKSCWSYFGWYRE